MLTPPFEVTQNDEFLTVSIQIPYAKVSDIQVQFEDFEFMVYSKPYYLRLNLPGKVSWTETPNIKYNDDKKTVTVLVPKANHGEVFEGLDLITKLLSSKKSKVVTSPLIEVIDGTNVDEDEEFDWSIEQVPAKSDEFSLLGQQECGFGDMYPFTVFNLKEEIAEMFEVTNPQHKSKKLLFEERLAKESDRFDEDHYIADLYEDDEIQQLFKFSPEWDSLYEEFSADSSINPDDLIAFTTEEKERLRKLPTKEYLLEKPQSKAALLGLIDMMFAYAYNKRTTEGENTVGSPWTINRLSATLSWMETFSSVTEVAVTCVRRSLIYPLFRHFELSLTVLEDVRKIFLLGRKYIIKCLLEIHEMFCLSDPRYILNDLYITDYCVWMQTKSCSTRKLIPLAEALGKVLLTKGDIGLNLVDIESFAKVAWMAHHSAEKSENKSESCKQPSTPDTLSSDLEKLTLQNNLSRNDDAASISSGNSNTVHNDFYRSCSSCTSDSSDSSSNTFDTDSSDDSNSENTASSSDSDDDTASSTDSDDAHRKLLRKANGERLR